MIYTHCVRCSCVLRPSVIRESELILSRVELLKPMKSSFGAENIIFGHISPMRVFGGFFVACIGLEGAFSLPYANGHARKSMHVGGDESA